MAQTKKRVTTWITALGQSPYETVNPFWYYCDQRDVIPLRIIFFYDFAEKGLKHRTEEIFNSVSNGYPDGHGSVVVKGIGFNDEDVTGLMEKVKQAYQNALKSANRLIVDVSPTTWSFVPVCFFSTARMFEKRVQEIIYLQYSAHRFRARPYPQIPIKAMQLHNLLTGNTQ